MILAKLKAVIINLTKVVRTALHDGASVSGLLITTEALDEAVSGQNSNVHTIYRR